MSKAAEAFLAAETAYFRERAEQIVKVIPDARPWSEQVDDLQWQLRQERRIFHFMRMTVMAFGLDLRRLTEVLCVTESKMAAWIAGNEPIPDVVMEFVHQAVVLRSAGVRGQLALPEDQKVKSDG